MSSQKATRWLPISHYGNGSADAGQRFASADRVIVGSAIVVNVAARKHDESSAAKPIVVTRTAWKAGSITEIANDGIENGVVKSA